MRLLTIRLYTFSSIYTKRKYWDMTTENIHAFFSVENSRYKIYKSPTQCSTKKKPCDVNRISVVNVQFFFCWCLCCQISVFVGRIPEIYLVISTIWCVCVSQKHSRKWSVFFITENLIAQFYLIEVKRSLFHRIRILSW